jgi:protein-disulfide isomerase
MKRFTFTALVATSLCCSTVSQAASNNTSQTTISPAERTKIEEVVHQYLLQKPEVIIEALQIIQRKQYEEAEKTIKKTQQVATQFADPLFHQAGDPTAGNVNGKITVVEFFDYQCPHCVNMGPVIDNIIKNNPDVRIVFKEFPIRGPMSEQASRAALAANLQGKYLEFHRALLVAASQPITLDLILKTAKTVGLNVEKLQTDMKSDAIDKLIASTRKLGQNLKLFGTPAFFIGKTNTDKNGKINYIAGQMDQQQMQNAINNA